MGGAAYTKRFKAWFLVLLTTVVLACDGSEPTTSNASRRTPRPASAPVQQPELGLPSGVPKDQDRIQFFLNLLETGHQEEVTWASEQLGVSAEAAAGPLTEMLTRNLVRNALLAENILTAMSTVVPVPGEIEALASAAASSDARVRLLAARALGNTASEAAVPVLLDLLADSFEPVALEALQAVEQLGFQSGIHGLVGRFPDRMNPRAAIAAVAVVAKRLSGAPLEPFLLTAWESEEPGLELASSTQLLKLDQEAWLPRIRKKLAPYLKTVYRSYVLEVLAQGNDPEILPGVIEHAASPDPSLAIPALGLLSYYHGREMIEPLWTATRSGNDDIRREAWYALIEAGEPKAFERLTSLLLSTDPRERAVAALVLAARKEHQSGAAMATALENELDPGVARKLAVGIALLDYRPGSTAIAGLLSREVETQPSLAVTANASASALLRLSTLTPAGVEMLVKLAGSGNEAIRMNVALVLGRACSGPTVHDALVALLGDPSIHVRRQAVESWLALKEATTDVLLQAYAVEADPDLKKRIVKVIRQIHYRWPR